MARVKTSGASHDRCLHARRASRSRMTTRRC
jgi:hypothetical protein